MIVRQQCRVYGCTKLGELRDTVKGIKRYRDLCTDCRRPKRMERFKIDNSKCEKCGKLGKNDRHRLGDPSRAYTRENVIVLCKNCHADAHGRTWKRIEV